MASVLAMQVLARSKSPPPSATAAISAAVDVPVALVQLEAERAAAEELLLAARQPSVRAALEQLAQQLAAIGASGGGTPLSPSYSTSVDELSTRFARVASHRIASRFRPVNISIPSRFESRTLKNCSLLRGDEILSFWIIG